MDIPQLQKTYPVFSYDSFEHSLVSDKLEMTFHFHCGDHNFVTTNTIRSVTQEFVNQIGAETLDLYVFQLGLAEIPSYWKAFLSPSVEIACGSLDNMQIKFWEKLFDKGLGEFFYVNQIKPFAPNILSKGLPRQAIENQSESMPTSEVSVLVPVGGGKDSAVALELLAEAGAKITTCSGHQGAASDVIGTFTKRHPQTKDIVFSRTLDSKLLELNSAGHPNGHTPFSSVLAFLTLLVAKLFGIPYIALANEHSANEATLDWNGILINHQYSKSFEFEEDFRNYVNQTFDHHPKYFSLLRPLYELQIVKLFTTYEPYFGVFKSCNVGQQTNTWCGKCPKCTFVALMLSAYLSDETITQIFQTPILSDLSLIKYVDQLIGIAEEKPFECVGTRVESKSALYLALQRRKEKELPALLANYAGWIQTREVELTRTAQQVLHSFETQHNVPEVFVPILQEKIKSL